MNIIPIAFCFDDNFSLPAWVSIKSLVDTANKKTIYSIYVLYDYLNEMNRSNLNRLVLGNRHSIKFINVKSTLKRFKSIKSVEFWPKITLSRLFIPEILKEDKVIYSDVDVIFKKDLFKVFNCNLENYHYAMVAAENLYQKPEGHRRISLYKNRYIFYNGFILFNSKLIRYEKVCKHILNIFEENKEKFGPSVDLELINSATSKIFRLPLKYCLLESLIIYDRISDIPEYDWLSKLYSDVELIYAIKNVVIIHYTVNGEHREKPWKRLNPPKNYLSYILNSPYKYDWLSQKIIKKAFRKSAFLKRLSNSKIYNNKVDLYIKLILKYILRAFH